MLFLFILLNQILCQQIFQQQGRINDTQRIQFNISKEEKLILEQNQLRFDFKFDFPTLIKFEIFNKTLNIKEEIVLESPQAQIGYLISNDFFLSQRNLTIIIEPLTEYKQQWYRYDIKANINLLILTRFQPEAGITNLSQAIYYNLNLTYETTGFYQIDLSFQQGKGEMFLKQCVNQNCTEQNNSSKIQLNYSQANCIEISKHQFTDLCNHELKIIAQKGSSYFLTFKHITTADVQFIRPNQVEQIQLKNQEASLMLGSQSKLNFLYSNSIIKGIQFCPENRISFESQIYVFSNQSCQITEDWDQNFYIQHPNSSKLKLQYINQIDVFYINSIHRLQQEKDSYYFFCIETIFQEVQFQIFVFDFELLVQIYFSNTTQYPNENENQFELIESNYKTLQIYNNNRMYIGIKTKYEDLEYEISIKDYSLNFLNLFQELDVKYCKSCSQEHRFEAKLKQLLFFHIYLDQIENQIESPQFSIIILNNGRVLKQKDQFISKSYIRIIFDVQADETYIFVTRSKVQQNVRFLLSDFRFLQLNQVGEMNVQYKKEEIYRIKKNQKNTFFFYFFIDVQRQIKFNNLQGSCEYEQISNNYFEVVFKNSQREDGYTYFNLEGIDEEQTFLINSKVEENIDKLSDSIFIDPMKIEQKIDSLVLTTNVANCQLINCDLFSNVSTFLQIEYSNQTKIVFNGYSNLSEYNKVIDQFYQPFQKLKEVQLKVQVPYKEKYYNFTSEKQRFVYKELNLDSKKDNNLKYFSVFYAFLYLVAIVFLGYIAIKMIFRKQVKAKLHKNIMIRRKNLTEEEEQIKIDDI